MVAREFFREPMYRTSRTAMLQMKSFTLRFSDRLDGFNDEPVQELVRDKDVAEVRDHFFERDAPPLECGGRAKRRHRFGFCLARCVGCRLRRERKRRRRFALPAHSIW